jgi:hypothetical protein
LRLIAFVAVLFAACDTPGVTLVEADVTGDSDRSLTITVHLEDSTLARALGWEDGVPGASVSLHRVNDEFELRTATTDSSGMIRLDDVLPGRYRIATYRVLKPDETEPTGGKIRAFGDGTMVQVDPLRQLDVNLRSDQVGSLVISEIRPAGRYAGPDWPDYTWFQYFEIYNNSDTTIFLDGMLWGHAFSFNNNASRFPCSETTEFRDDPGGLWTAYHHRFPGSGSEHPIAPGQTVVVALDGVDHSVVHPNLPDLSQADFELEGTADVDNPDVPNVTYVGRYFPLMTHGLEASCSHGCFLARPQALETLERRQYPLGSIEWLRIPANAVLDVVTTDIWHPNFDMFDPCYSQVPRSMDRLGAPLWPVYYDANLALARRTLRVKADGRPVLQDLNVSFADLTEVPRSPGWIEY